MTTPALAPTISIGELLAELDRGAPLFLLDVRNAEDFAAWRIEARKPTASLNLPYFTFLEEPEAALARLPRERPIVVVCAKGGSSEMVVELLRDAGVPARNVTGGMAAYGEHLEREALSFSTAARFALWQVNRRGKGCLAYVLCAGDEALVIDPSRHVEWYESLLAELGVRLVRVLDTHVHADHLSGGSELSARTGAVYSVGVETARGEPLVDGQRLRLGGSSEHAVELEVLATPGHTPGSASFLLEKRYLFSGDTLFVRGLGRPDLGGQAEAWGRALFRTLHGRLARLSDDTVILPAHTSGVEEAGEHGLVRGTLGALRRSAEFRIASEDEFARSVARGVAPAPEAYAALVRANLGQAAPEPDEIAEWELGKNRCATSAHPE
jgi:glyoxylase-like metal-dependent hydrolase (beta-lactamase superfamily II)/rhodanese-related sulfurtransferase